MSIQQFSGNKQSSHEFTHNTPERKVMASRSTTPNSKHGAFAKVLIDETPKHLFGQPSYNFNYLDTPEETPRYLFRDFGSLICKPLMDCEYFRSPHQNKQIPTSSLRHHFHLNFSQEQTFQKQSKLTEKRDRFESDNRIQQQQMSSSEYIAQHTPTNNNKSKRTHEKGLKNLSQMVLNIVNQLGLTTYKDVTDKLLELLIEQGVSSKNMKDQTNVKRRAYDILNVLVSSGQLQKVGKKIGPHNCELSKLRKQLNDKKKTVQKKQSNLRDMRKKFLQQVKSEEQKIPKEILEFMKQMKQQTYIS